MQNLYWAVDGDGPSQFGVPATLDEERDTIPVHALDPSVSLAAWLLVRVDVCSVERIFRLYAPQGEVDREWVPAFVGALAAQLDAGVKRVGPDITQLAIVSRPGQGGSPGS